MNIIEQEKIIRNALKEDIGRGDITTNAIVPGETKIRAILLAKEDGIIAGLPITKRTLMMLDKNITFKEKIKEGSFVRKGTIIAEMNGSARAILTGERVALNFLQRMSGIATLTRRFVTIAKNIKIKDTRKTTPGLRIFEKYAVRIGGGVNHRARLDEAVLIKDNHVRLAGGVKEALRSAKKNCKGKKIEVEVTNLPELKEALAEGVHYILLDNMDPKTIRKAAMLAKGKELEISGGVNLANIQRFKNMPVYAIAIGALTHSAKALDISLEVES